MRNLLSHGGDPRELGIETGLRYSLTSTGILGYALLSSPTIRDALTVLERFDLLLSSYYEVSFRETPSGMLVEVADGDVPPDVHPFLLPRDLVAGFRIAGFFLSPAVLELIAELNRLVRLELPDATALAYADDARELLAPFGITLAIESGSDRTAFTIPHELLSRPTPAPDPATTALCIQQCEQLLDERSRFTGTAAQVRHLLLRDPSAMPTLPAVARAQGISDRTLHRRLAEEHTNFRALVDRIRQEIAAELLDLGLTVEAVSRHLGYTDTAALTHAHNRWHGHPPTHPPPRHRPLKSASR